MGYYKPCIECLHTCLEINQFNEDANKLLECAKPKAIDNDSDICPDYLSELEEQVKDVLESMKKPQSKSSPASSNIASENDPGNSEIAGLISLNSKIHIINEILKPLSCFEKEWNLETKFGFDHEDLYSS